MMKSSVHSTRCFRLIIASILLVLISSCNVYRYVPEKDYLFTGSKIKFTTKTKNESEIKSALLSKTWPGPNQKIALLPLPLVSYSISKPTNKKGLNHLLHDKFGEPPVLLSQAKPNDMRRRMLLQLYDMGFLKASLHDSVVINKRKAYINFVITTGKRYTIDTVVFPSDSSRLSKAIAEIGKQTLLIKGTPFTLENINTERERIDLELRNKGYFYFIPDFLSVAADTNHNNHALTKVVVKPNLPSAASKTYTINNFTIYSNYSSDRDSILHKLPVNKEDGFKHVDTLPRFKPVLFRQNILFKEGDLYSYKKHRTTVQRMVNLNNFKFINTAFTPSDSTAEPSLDVELFLTPFNRRSMQAEIGAYSKSNNFAGTEIKLKLTNRNLFHKGDHLELDLSGGFESLVKSTNKEYYSNQNYSGSINFYRPVFHLPVKIKRVDSEYIPRNKISAGAEYLRKPKLYTSRSLRFSFGYLWKTGENWEHIYDPFVLSIINPTNITPEYDSTLAQDPNLAKSFEKQFIIGGEYTLNYNSTQRKSSIFQIHNITTIGLSGNLLSLFVKPANVSGNQEDFLGVPYAQYLLASNDFRVYMKLTQRTTWVNRLFFGYGFSYANSEIMPYSKQFFIGGSNSLRAFRNGTLGPGSYSDSLIKSQAVQAGEIKFEYNSEFRFKLTKYIFSALFTDVGNIWFRNEQPDAPGSGFTSSWYKELAVDAGIGLRIDANIMVIRLDLAIPLRIPSLPDGQRWVIDEVNLGSKPWRKNNVVFNIAFGYPF
ncbi:MAG: BamA/TamA family outer membrane protein [Bacteroidales bacterium]